MKRFLASVWKHLRLPKSVQLWVMRKVQDQFLVGVTGVILNDKKEVLLFRHTYRQNEWGLPGGYIKATEHPKEGLEREILEESGFVVSIDDRYRIRTDRDSARLDIVYIGSLISGSFTPSDEVIDAKFFPFKDLPDVSKGQLLLIHRIVHAEAESGNH